MSTIKTLAVAQASLLAGRPDLCLEDCAPLAGRDHPAGLWLSGLAALATGDFEAAERRLARLRAVDPAFRGDPAVEARVLASCSRPAQAEALLRGRPVFGPGDLPGGTRVFMVESYLNLGNIFALMDDPDNCVVLASDTEANRGFFGDFLRLKRVVYYPRFLLTGPTGPQVPHMHDWPRVLQLADVLAERILELVRSLPADATLYWWARYGAMVQYLVVDAFRKLGRETIFVWNPSWLPFERWPEYAPDAFGAKMAAVLEQLSLRLGMRMTVLGYTWTGREKSEIKSGVAPVAEDLGRQAFIPPPDWGAVARRFEDCIAAVAPAALDHDEGTVLLMGDDYALYRHILLEPSVRAFNFQLHDMAAAGRTFHLKPHYNGASSHWISDMTAARALKGTLTANLPSELLMQFYGASVSVSSMALMAAVPGRKLCLLDLFHPDPDRSGVEWIKANRDAFALHADSPVEFVKPSPDWP